MGARIASVGKARLPFSAIAFSQSTSLSSTSSHVGFAHSVDARRQPRALQQQRAAAAAAAAASSL